MKKVSRVAIPIALASLLLMFFVPVVYAQFNPPSPPSGAVQEIKPTQLVTTISNWFFWIAGLVVVIVIVYGGIMYGTAGGDEDKMAKAKTIIIYALIGVVIILSAWAVVSFIAGHMGGQAI